MSDVVGRLVAEVTADVSKAEQQISTSLSKAGDAGAKSFGQKFAGGVQKAAVPATVALGGLAAAGFGAIKSAEGQATANARLQQVLDQMGYSENAQAAIDMADSLEQVIAVDSATIKESQALLATFSDLAGSQELLGRTTKVAADLAAAGYGDMSSASVGLGKALQDPITGMSLLSKQGSLTKQEQKEIGEEFKRTGDKAAAQDAILAALEKQVGGVAAVTADTSDKIKLGFGEIVESVGAALLPAFDALAPRIQQFADWASRNGPLLVKVGAAIAGVAAAIIGVNIAMKAFAAVKAIITGVQTAWLMLNVVMAASPIGVIVVAIVALVAALVLAWKNSETFRNIVIGAWEAIKGAVMAVVDWFTGTVWPALQAVWEAISGGVAAMVEVVSGLWAGIQAAAAVVVEWFTGTLLPGLQAVWDGVVAAVEVLVKIVKGYFTLWVKVVTTAWDAIAKVATTVWNAIKTTIDTVLKVIKGVIEFYVNAYKRVWDGIVAFVSKVAEVFGKVRDKITEWLRIIKDWVVEKVTAVVTAYFNVWRTLIGKVVEVFTTVRDKVGEWIGLIKTKVEEKVGAVVGAFKTAISKVVNVGRDIVDGLWRGISGAWDWVMGKVRGLVDRLPAIVKKALGISSPSKVFAAIGGNMVEGLQVGLDDAKDGLARDLARLVPSTAYELTIDPRLSVGAVPAWTPPPFGSDGAWATPVVQVFIGDEQLDARMVRVTQQRDATAAARLIAGGVGRG